MLISVQPIMCVLRVLGCSNFNGKKERAAVPRSMAPRATAYYCYYCLLWTPELLTVNLLWTYCEQTFYLWNSRATYCELTVNKPSISETPELLTVNLIKTVRYLLWAIYCDDESVMMLLTCCRQLCVGKAHFVLFCVNCLHGLENECLLLPKCWLIFVSVRNRHS
jgi:hypothetical protein